MAYTHFDAEGEISFKSLLYIPGSAPKQMMSDLATLKSSLKLFVRRVCLCVCVYACVCACVVCVACIHVCLCVFPVVCCVSASVFV